MDIDGSKSRRVAQTASLRKRKADSVQAAAAATLPCGNEGTREEGTEGENRKDGEEEVSDVV